MSSENDSHSPFYSGFNDLTDLIQYYTKKTSTLL